ncbi:stevor [Plasmodium falciparum IGH-CR14]|uniref:Stevor n=1 Tax=Plasmodium falciparum IGH-CR14 TaxID=580059 RepID=A0A0L1I8J7_PLAFA|nr:stevor [Plasmodium falciparum IGH-CR14]
MNMYYVKMLLFAFLINTLVLPYNEKYINNHNNINVIRNDTQRTTIKCRLLAQTQIHNPHYHNDPELKEIIDKMNEEAIKKYQQTHDPYKQLKEVVEKNGTKHVGGHVAEPMSAIEKELLETYEEMFGNESDMLKSGIYPNDNDESDKSLTCECTDTNSTKLTTGKGKDKYLKHLKKRCTRGIYSCSVVSAFLAWLGLVAAKTAAQGAVANYATYKTCVSSISIFSLPAKSTVFSALKAAGGSCASSSDLVGTIANPAMAAFEPYGIAALVLLILVVVIIILYIWLYRRRKNSLKHECKKHLCK